MAAFGRMRAAALRPPIDPNAFQPGFAGGGGAMVSPSPLPPDPIAPDAPKTTQSQQPVGFFGGLRNWFSKHPHALEIIGSGLQEAGGNRGALDGVLDRIMQDQRQQGEDAWRQTMQQHQLGAWKQGDEDRRTAAAAAAARAAALERIPEELRPYVELGIEGPITQYARNHWPTPSRARAGAAGEPVPPPDYVWSD